MFIGILTLRVNAERAMRLSECVPKSATLLYLKFEK